MVGAPLSVIVACFAFPRLGEATPAAGDVRLLDLNGVVANAGLLQVYADDHFGTVCGMDSGAARVVCRMLGYDHGSLGSSPCSSYGGSNLCGAPGSAVAMKALQCDGGELQISGCQWIAADQGCSSHEKDAVAFCSMDTASGVYADGTLRLVSYDGAPSIDGTGRLDMFRAGVWGSVCVEGFTQGSAAVACKQMGFTAGELHAEASGCKTQQHLFCAVPPHVSDLSCTGREPDIVSCPFEDGEDVFCAASESVVLQCVGDGDALGRPAKVVPPRLL